MNFGSDDQSLADALLDPEELQDVEDLQVCGGCGSDSQSPHPLKSNEKLAFIRQSKCSICHVLHLIEYGETAWGASQPNMTTQWH